MAFDSPEKHAESHNDAGGSSSNELRFTEEAHSIALLVDQTRSFILQQNRMDAVGVSKAGTGQRLG
jgi:hypothetical protein